LVEIMCILKNQIIVESEKEMVPLHNTCQTIFSFDSIGVKF
jgi:hypothetical protein